MLLVKYPHGTKALWIGEIMPSIIILSLLAKTLATSLYMTLQRLMGLKSSTLLASFTLGIRVMKVSFILSREIFV